MYPDNILIKQSMDKVASGRSVEVSGDSALAHFWETALVLQAAATTDAEVQVSLCVAAAFYWKTCFHYNDDLM